MTGVDEPRPYFPTGTPKSGEPSACQVKGWMRVWRLG